MDLSRDRQQTIINFWPSFSSFNRSPSLPSVAKDDIEQFQCSKVVLGNKTRPVFGGFH